MTDWQDLSARGGLAGHHLVGWLMWDRAAIDAYADLGIEEGRGWVVAWRVAALGDASPAVAAAATYSIHPNVVEFVMNLYRGVATAEQILAVRDTAIEPALRDIAPEVAEGLGALATDLWRGVDVVHHGARTMFQAHRARPRPDTIDSCLSGWLAANCLRELRGDNHWALCAAADLDDVEVGLLHAAMVDVDEYGGEEWIARSRGADDAAVSRGWERLEAKGFAEGARLSETGRQFRQGLERRTDALCVDAWKAVGAEAAEAYCELIERNQQAFKQRIDDTAGPRWMPAVRVVEESG
ncbi:MAG: hypothetical protein AAF567_15015 [Actinomycetota bacterium]